MNDLALPSSAGKSQVNTADRANLRILGKCALLALPILITAFFGFFQFRVSTYSGLWFVIPAFLAFITALIAVMHCGDKQIPGFDNIRYDERNLSPWFDSFKAWQLLLIVLPQLVVGYAFSGKLDPADTYIFNDTEVRRGVTSFDIFSEKVRHRSMGEGYRKDLDLPAEGTTADGVKIQARIKIECKKPDTITDAQLVAFDQEIVNIENSLREAFKRGLSELQSKELDGSAQSTKLTAAVYKRIGEMGIFKSAALAPAPNAELLIYNVKVVF